MGKLLKGFKFVYIDFVYNLEKKGELSKRQYHSKKDRPEEGY
jgi:hypothetical protein